MKQVYTSIDLGSDTIKVVVCDLFNNKINLLAASSIKSDGIKKGLITDVEKASKSLKEAVSKVEEMLGIQITRAIVSMPSYYTDFEMVKGSINLDSQELINGDDISNLLEVAANTRKIKDKEIITIIPVDFTIDGASSIKNPKDKQGEVLSTRSIVVLSPKKNILSVIKLLEKCGIETVDVSLNSIGDIYAIHDREIKEQVGAIVNIGSETTTVSLYNKGIIVKSSVLGFGGKNIDNDISYIYNTTLEESNKIKEKFALAHKRYASVNDVIEVKNKQGETIKINQVEVTEVVTARIEAMLLLVKNEINLLTNREVDYIRITGGTSSMTNFSLISEEILGKKTKTIDIKLVGLRHNKYSSAVGNIVYFIGKLKLKGKKYSMVSKEDINTLLQTKRNVISEETMLGKVFGYFFSE